MGNTFYFQWEVTLMEWIQCHMGTAGVMLANIFSMFGEDMLAILVMGLFYWCLNKELGLYIGLNMSMASIWNPMIKNVALRRRPYFDNPTINCLRPVDSSADLYDVAAQGYSFPSGHSSGAASVYGTIAMYFRKKWVTALCLIIIALVGISRFCLGVHYPTDVLCGWALGAFTIWIVGLIRAKTSNKWIAYGILLITAIPGFFYCRTNDYFSGIGILIGLILGNLFEEKFVNFEETRNPVKIVLRLAGGVAVYLILNKVLKMPFSEEFLASETIGAFLVRAVRYAIVVFVDLGIYPMLFRKPKKQLQ